MPNDLTVATAEVAPVFTKFGKARIYDMIAAEAITIGDAVCFHTTTGKLHPANASTGGAHLLQFKGIALNAASTNDVVSVLVHGMVKGFDLSGVAMTYGAKVYLSTTAGAIADDVPGGADIDVEVGEVWPLSDKDIGTVMPTKVLMVDVNLGDIAHS